MWLYSLDIRLSNMKVIQISQWPYWPYVWLIVTLVALLSYVIAVARCAPPYFSLIPVATLTIIWFGRIRSNDKWDMFWTGLFGRFVGAALIALPIYGCFVNY